jgi:hypothetical protein
MSAPIISIYEVNVDKTTGAQTEGSSTNSWAPGVVKAGEESKEKVVALWNNHDNDPGTGGTDTIHDMIEVSVTALDSTGGVSDPIAKDSWIQVNVNGQQKADTEDPTKMVDVWKPIGKDNTVKIWNAAADTTAFTGDDTKDYVLKGTDTSANANNGFGYDKEKYAVCRFKIAVPATANPGSTGFKIRFQGYYV